VLKSSAQPYSDFRVHDMGPDLADRSLDGSKIDASWRTAPLWGMSAHLQVSGFVQLLHDGRAADVEQAILWHGGEALVSRNRFASLSARQRKLLIDFVRTL